MKVRTANLTRFSAAASQRYGHNFDDYKALHHWSVTYPAEFWQLVWDFCGVVASRNAQVVLSDFDRMPGARWFEGARLNFAENLLRTRDGMDSPAIIFGNEDAKTITWSREQLYRRVSAIAAAMRAAGVEPKDVVAAWLPNIPDTVAIALAAASCGAIFSSCSPDFGVEGVIDRFAQLQPKLLFGVDGYCYNGKRIDCIERLEAITQALSPQQTILVSYLQPQSAHENSRYDTLWQWASTSDAPLLFEQLPFDHPLYVLFSSGTTGKPKGIVHSAGGTLLQHLKEHQLHCDLQPNERIFYYTTCGWMMWNWLISALASSATLLLYDGAPMHPHKLALFDFADKTQMNVFGTSAKYIESLAKYQLRPSEEHRLAALRLMLSTGSPLCPEGFDYVYQYIKPDLCLSSISGGTDIVSCFALGNPTLPVHRGEIQCKGLGMDVDVFDDDGNSLRGRAGELVCKSPFPSMPTEFWNDPNGVRYHAAYFERYPGVWHHGDFAEVTKHDGIVIYGRSDATLNPGGVRIGTAEIYRQLEQIDEVLEAVVVAQRWQNDVRIVLFVKLRPGNVLDQKLQDRIRTVIRSKATPRHVPAKILEVFDIPRTKNGKISELAVRAVVHGEAIKNAHALANPEALQEFTNRSELDT